MPSCYLAQVSEGYAYDFVLSSRKFFDSSAEQNNE